MANQTYQETLDKHRHWVQLAALASVLTALLLIASKAIAWYYTSSASMLGSLLDSIMDSAASLINLVAIQYALKPPDKEHKFGHGKAEALAAIAQSSLIAVSSCLLIFYAARRGYTGEIVDPDKSIWGIGVTLFAIVITLALVAFQKFVTNRTHSQVIAADSLHYTSDLLLNISVLLALWASSVGWHAFDWLLGIGIGLYLLRGAGSITLDAFDVLMDRELPDEIRNNIKELSSSVEGVCNTHGLRTRRSGGSYIIQIHLDMEPQLSLAEAHRNSDLVQQAIVQAYPNAEVTTHIDPVAPEQH